VVDLEPMKRILITGVNGLIGRSCVEKFLGSDASILGIDNDARATFFGEDASTSFARTLGGEDAQSFTIKKLDITNRLEIEKLLSDFRPDLVIHTAAQPSHDKAAQIPYLDFETNAVGTLNLLESLRKFNLDGVFVHLSTNKVYGDSPNLLPIKELDSRFDFNDAHFGIGIGEYHAIDSSLHSLFGVSKLSADVLVQEYGRYFGMKTCVLRAGCLTGANHKGVELHGFLSWLVKCNLSESNYSIFGYKGKQVRDNLHAKDVAEFIYQFTLNPGFASIYNLGGGYENSISVIEAIDLVTQISGIKMKTTYIDSPRKGDHIVYYSDLSKIKRDFPDWKVSMNLHEIVSDLVGNEN